MDFSFASPCECNASSSASRGSIETAATTTTTATFAQLLYTIGGNCKVQYFHVLLSSLCEINIYLARPRFCSPPPAPFLLLDGHVGWEWECLTVPIADGPIRPGQFSQGDIHQSIIIVSTITLRETEIEIESVWPGPKRRRRGRR